MTVESRDINTAIIGAGPGGLMAARHLGESDKGGSTIVFEQGREYRGKCPALFHQQDCRGCGGICHIINGVGGACSDVSCGLLSRYPAGTGLTKFLPPGEIEQIEDQIIEWLQHIHRKPLTLISPNLHKDILDRLQQEEIDPKSYPSYEILGDEFTALINGIFRDVQNLRNVEIRFSTTVTNIERDSQGGFFVYLSTGERIHANHVIFAGGRAGIFDALNIWTTSLGINVENMKGYLGLRIEGPVSEELLKLKELVADPKFKRDGLRIFCFCPNGRVVGIRNSPRQGPMAGKKFDSLEGCVDPGSEFGNFSIQKEVVYPIQEYWKFLQGLFAFSGGKIVSQSLESLVNRGEPRPFPSTIKNRMVVGRIEDFLENATLVSEIVDFLFTLNNIFNNGIITKDTGLHSPELHLWPQLNLGPGFELNKVRGAYVIGDLSGVARGIMQAIVMGVVAANNIITNS